MGHTVSKIFYPGRISIQRRRSDNKEKALESPKGCGHESASNEAQGCFLHVMKANRDAIFSFNFTTPTWTYINTIVNHLGSAFTTE